MEKYFIGIYCPPAVPAGGYPNRVTLRSYQLLKDVGVDHVFGYFEADAGEEYLHKALQYSAETGITYYPRLEIYNHFFGITGSELANYKDFPTYGDMSAQEQQALHKAFLEGIAACADYPSFGGIFMGDERRNECFPGIGVAYKLFQNAYPDKQFLYNNINYMSDDDFFEYCKEPVDERLAVELLPLEENRFKRYEYFIGLYMKEVAAEYISTDVYSFCPTWKELPTAIHRNLYEIQSFFANIKCKTGRKPLVYVQTGNWDDDVRNVGKPEMALTFGISAAYDCDGFVFFPGCWPNDWLETPEGFAKDGKAALLDAHSEPTRYYGYAKQILAHFQKIAGYIHGAQWLGVETIGAFEGGFVNTDPDTLKWGSCIYRGGLPENEKHRYTGALPEISTDKQLFIGAFRDGEQTYLLLVNNTIVGANRIRLDAAYVRQIIQDGVCSDYTGGAVDLEPGESVLAILN